MPNPSPEPVDLAQFEGCTPGPWFASQYMDDDRWGVCSSENEILVRLTSGLTKPDAKLLAAAPDLLAEVIRLRAALSVERSVVVEECAQECDKMAFLSSVKLKEQTFKDAAARIRALGQEGDQMSTTLSPRKPIQHEDLWDAMSRYANDHGQTVEDFADFPFKYWPTAVLTAFLNHNSQSQSLSLFTLNRIVAVRRAHAQRQH